MNQEFRDLAGPSTRLRIRRLVLEYLGNAIMMGEARNWTTRGHHTPTQAMVEMATSPHVSDQEGCHQAAPERSCDGIYMYIMV